MKIKAIVTDLDSTLLRKDKSISAYTVKVLNECKERGIKLFFATARPLHATYRIQEAVSPDYLISNNGASVYCRDEMIANTAIPASTVQELMAKLNDLPEAEIIMYEHGNGMICSDSELKLDGDWQVQYHDFNDSICVDTSRISIATKNIDRLRAVVESFPGLYLCGSSEDYWTQVLSKGVSKAQGIGIAAEHLGIDLKEIMAFGDGYNDREMIAHCGIGIAMGNAIAEIKERADFVCATNEEDGVATWIEERVLKRI
jgi:HAD-superfamily hydrolase, subfamily IIB